MKEIKTKYKVGQDNFIKWGFDIHNPVFVMSSLLIIFFVGATLIGDPKATKATLDGIKWDIIGNFDWLFIWGGNIFVLFCIALIVLPVGKIRFGGVDAKPDFSTISWFSMLFAAGMGIGLMFWSVAEPIAYYTAWYKTPLNVLARTPEAEEMAMAATMFHWGFHPWAIYAVVGASLAYFSYNHNLPLSIRSTFFPLFREKTWGWPGHIIDTLAVLATLFGLATSLGLGAQQAAGGLNFLFGWDKGTEMQILLIAIITGIAVISVLRGLEGGVKVLSNINMSLALILLLFIIAVTFTTFFSTLTTTVTGYLKNLIPLSNPIGREDTAWFQGWTIFYWAWWISWSPFVGMFIARISRGRSIREFTVAVLLVPTAVTMVWMSAFGGAALEQVKNNVGILAEKGITDVSLAMFQMFQNIPLTGLLSFLGIVLVIVFFVTSSDSGSLVIDSITAGGKLDAPAPQRVFWAVIEGLIAAILLFVGGTEAIQALQAGAISTGLPFVIVLLLMCVSLGMALNHEYQQSKS